MIFDFEAYDFGYSLMVQETGRKTLIQTTQYIDFEFL